VNVFVSAVFYEVLDARSCEQTEAWLGNTGSIGLC
jgi:hypothetical protein